MNTPKHYQTGRGTLCSLDNDASIRTHTEDVSMVTCCYCLNLLPKKEPVAQTSQRDTPRYQWAKIANEHYARLGPCPYFGDFGSPGGHIYGDKNQDDHCQLCGQPKP